MHVLVDRSYLTRRLLSAIHLWEYTLAAGVLLLRPHLHPNPHTGVHPGFGRTPGPPAGWVATPPQGRAAFGDPPVTADGRLSLALGRAVRLLVVFASGLANPLLVTASDWGSREESIPPLPASAYGLRRGNGGRP